MYQIQTIFKLSPLPSLLVACVGGSAFYLFQLFNMPYFIPLKVIACFVKSKFVFFNSSIIWLISSSDWSNIILFSIFVFIVLSVGFAKNSIIMNEDLEKFIGKYITVTVKLFVAGSLKEEHIQGIFKAIERDILVIEQCVPFCNLFIKNADLTRIERKIAISNTFQNSIKFF